MKRGGRTVFVRAQIVDGAGELIALGQGTFRLFEKP
jgi:acyl-coenzyme A thioesterase PaaI-like protein